MLEKTNLRDIGGIYEKKNRNENCELAYDGSTDHCSCIGNFTSRNRRKHVAGNYPWLVGIFIDDLCGHSFLSASKKIADDSGSDESSSDRSFFVFMAWGRKG